MERIQNNVFESELEIEHYLWMLVGLLLGQNLEVENTSFLATRFT